MIVTRHVGIGTFVTSPDSLQQCSAFPRCSRGPGFAVEGPLHQRGRRKSGPRGAAAVWRRRAVRAAVGLPPSIDMMLQRLTAKGRLVSLLYAATPLLALMCGDGLLNLLFHVLHVEACTLLHGGYSMNVWAYSATSCCTKTKRQNW